jgi:hypothetical protein
MLNSCFCCSLYFDGLELMSCLSGTANFNILQISPFFITGVGVYIAPLKPPFYTKL